MTMYLVGIWLFLFLHPCYYQVTRFSYSPARLTTKTEEEVSIFYFEHIFLHPFLYQQHCMVNADL